MDNIDLFDKYIKGELSEKERREFDTRLKDDKSFADEFKVYSATVIGICKEAEQDNMDFEMAMKNISKEKLKEIIGWQPREVLESKGNNTSEDSITPASSPVISIPLYRRQWLWQAASFAILVVSVIWIFNINQNADIRIAEANKQTDNLLYAYNYTYAGPTRGGFSIPDLNTLSDAQLEEILPKIVDAYEESYNIRGGEVNEDLYEYGYPLAMAYLRLHKRDKALVVLNNLIAKLSCDEDYAEEVSKLKSIVIALK